eukprot:XP_001706859.1 Hypothetical protein GL50803_32680 [Giardia lamblia ATCC 50803]
MLRKGSTLYLATQSVTSPLHLHWGESQGETMPANDVFCTTKQITSALTYFYGSGNSNIDGILPPFYPCRGR